MNVQVFIAQVINGLAMGSVYAVVVVGMNLLVLVRGVTHFAYAHIVIISMYALWMALGATDNNLAIAIPIGIVTAVAFTVLSEPFFRPLAKRKALLETVVVALGMGIILTEVMAQFLNYGLAISFPANLVGAGGRITFGMISFSLGNLYSLLGCFAAVMGLFYFLYRRRLGLAFRAVAQDVETARLLGIPINKTGIYSFAIGGILAGISGLLLAMTLGAASPSLGDSLAIKAVVVILFAGLGNLKGGLVAALLVGVAEGLLPAYLPGRWSEAILFTTIMMVIIIKPHGLFGARV